MADDATSLGDDGQWLAGRKVLVTGAAGTLGVALVHEADRRGATVVAAGRSPSLDAASLPDAALRVTADLSDPDACRGLVREAAERLGGLDIVVNNAAVLVRKPFAELTLEELNAAWEVNLRAPALIMQEALPYLENGSTPAIVNVVSTAGFSGGIAQVSAYGMAKAGLIVLTKSVAREVGPRGIRVFALSPPTLPSTMQAELDEETRARVRALNVLGRPASAEETARFTFLAASGLGGLVTGSTIDLSATVY